MLSQRLAIRNVLSHLVLSWPRSLVHRLVSGRTSIRTSPYWNRHRQLHPFSSSISPVASIIRSGNAYMA